MTVQECYVMMHGTYEDVKRRLPSDRIVERIMLKFPMDPSMQQLRDALAVQDVAAARSALHSMEGVTANLALTGLYNAAQELHTPLRDGSACDDALVQKVEAEYQLILDTLKKYQDEKQ